MTGYFTTAEPGLLAVVVELESESSESEVLVLEPVAEEVGWAVLPSVASAALVSVALAAVKVDSC